MTVDPTHPNLPRVVIVGGGSAGWMTAAGLVGLLGHARPSVTLVESDAIGIVGVGEATLPHLRHFNQAIGLDEALLMERARGSFKLGIRFIDWGEIGRDYIHPFGSFGRPAHGYDFHQAWTQDRSEPLERYSYAIQAMRAHRFARPDTDPLSLGATIDHAYHFDASLYAALLRDHSEARGVRRVEGRIVGVERRPASGDVAALVLESGERIDGDLFVDCSGFRALLIGSELAAPWEDWSHWLPCDRAWAVPSERTTDFHPYTKVTARSAGWQWRIPLQHRTGNGHVFASRHMGEEQARAVLLEHLDGPALDEPRLLRFTAGRRAEAWTRNVVAIGLSSGFLEPLESTSIYLIQRGVELLAALFPTGPDLTPLASEFNRAMDFEYSRIRDFLILHYKLGRRAEPMWRDCAAMDVPASLIRKMALFRESARLEPYRSGLFSPPSWVSVMIGQGLEPRAAHPLQRVADPERLGRELADIRAEVAARVAALPGHDEAVRAAVPAVAA